jgi:hypothetical protein
LRVAVPVGQQTVQFGQRFRVLHLDVVAGDGDLSLVLERNHQPSAPLQG